MKRFIALLLAIVTLLTITLGLFGCSSISNAVLTMGQWLALVNDAFGMESYISDDPHFSNVDKTSPYYDTVQIAAEWDVVSGDTIDTEKEVTWEDVLISLVNVGAFLPADSTDAEKIEYAIQKFDTSIRKYWMRRVIDANKAVELLTKAQTLWANKTYSERVEKVVYSENVRDLASEGGVSISKNEDNTFVIEGTTQEIREGDIFAVPSGENHFEKEYVKVESVSEEDGKTVITPSNEELELEDIYDQLYFEETLVPTPENTVIRDGNGNVISAGPSVTNQKATTDSAQIVPLGAAGNTNANAANCASSSYSFTTIDGYKVGLSYNLNGTFNLAASIEMPNMLPKSVADNGHELKLSAGAEISNLTVTPSFDWEKVLGISILRGAGLRVGYTAKQTFGIKYAGKQEFPAAPGYSNGNGQFLSNFKRAIMKQKKGKDVYGAKTIKICSIDVYSVGAASICLDVMAKITVEGTAELTVTENGTKGVEYKNGNLRYIKQSERSLDAQAKAKIEVTLGIGPALYALGLKKKLLGFEVKGGLGAQASIKAHLADDQMHLLEELDFSDVGAEAANVALQRAKDISANVTAIQAIAESRGGIYKAQAGETKVILHVDCCIDVKVYGILSIGLSDESYLTQLLKMSKVSFSVDILNAKNATFLNMHVDNFQWTDAVYAFGADAKGDNCTLKYVPFDKATDEAVTNEDVEASRKNISVGEVLGLEILSVTMNEGQSYLINITTLPKGYNADDIVFTSKDEKVATVTKEGIIHAVKEGCTMVCAETKDGKYSAFVAVIVKAETVGQPNRGGGGFRGSF